MADFVVAVTGGIASGKSAVTDLFARRGVHVADADAIAHAIAAPGGAALAEIVARFGDAMIGADGALDRARMRTLVFADAGARADLEAITHPRIRAGLEQACREAPGPYAIAAIPLLAESLMAESGRAKSVATEPAGWRWLQRVLVVDAPVAVQEARLRARDQAEAALARRMIAAQATRAQRLALANDVIVNDGALEALEPVVLQLDERYRVLARERAAAAAERN